MIQIRSRLVSLRFRHWSRKSFAAFHSTGKHVTIGNLKTIIADRLLGKQKSTAQGAESDEKNFDPGIIALASEDPPEDNLELIIPEFRRNKNTTPGCEPARVRRGLHYSAWLKALVMIASGHFYFNQSAKNK